MSDGPEALAIRMLAEKLKAHERMLSDVQSEIQVMHENPDANEAKEKIYYVLRGPINDRLTGFFRGNTTKEQFMEWNGNTDLPGVWKFQGISSTKYKNTHKYTQENQDRVDEENESFFNDDGLFSRQWYAIVNYDMKEYDIVPDPITATNMTLRTPLQSHKFDTHLKAVEYCRNEMRGLKDDQLDDRDALPVKHRRCRDD